MSQDKSTNVVWHQATVERSHREKMNSHKSAVLWFTGLSGAGKSTLAHAVEEILHEKNIRTFVLDGDNVRHGLCGDLGFSDEDRQENIRRVGEVAKIIIETGAIVLTAFISPFKSDRDRVRALVDQDDFIEVYVKCSLEKCEERDVKGLYKKARAGEIKEFTGISSPYEAPENAEVVVDTGELDLRASAEKVVDYLVKKGIVSFN